MPKNNQPPGCIQTVLQADYGDAAQRAFNAKSPNTGMCKQLLAKHQEHKHAHPSLQVCSWCVRMYDDGYQCLML